MDIIYSGEKVSNTECSCFILLKLKVSSNSTLEHISAYIVSSNIPFVGFPSRPKGTTN